MSTQPHIVPVRIYLTIIAILMVLTIITVAVAFMDLGYLNLMVAVGIAIVKAVLVVMFFMHLKYSAKILWMCAAAGGIFFIIMIAFLLGDYHSRDWIARPMAWDAPAVVQAAVPTGAPVSAPAAEAPAGH